MNPATPLAPPNTEPLKPGELIDEREAAAILGCAVQTLRNLRWRREPPKFYRIGKRMVRYKRADLAAYVEAGNGNAAA